MGRITLSANTQRGNHISHKENPQAPISSDAGRINDKGTHRTLRNMIITIFVTPRKWFQSSQPSLIIQIPPKKTIYHIKKAHHKHQAGFSISIRLFFINFPINTFGQGTHTFLDRTERRRFQTGFFKTLFLLGT